jgi:hypothetical protein
VTPSVSIWQKGQGGPRTSNDAEPGAPADVLRPSASARGRAQSLGVMNIAAKQSEEIDLAARLFAALGHRQVALEKSDRPDVIAQISGSRIGIEVTQFHADEQKDAKGSSLRATEERLAKQSPGRSYAMWGVAKPNPALIARITDKVAIAAGYDTSRYSQLWLLISTGIPRLGAIGSTLAVPAFINIKDLNVSAHELLSGSTFSVVYLHMLLPRALYCWSRERQWRAIAEGEG